jgi:chromosome segregation ATPase
LRQIEGRAWRQGNKNEHVRINFMLTNDSIDVFMLQKLQAKQARYLEAMKKGADVLDISDISTQELKTSIITDPVTRADIEIELLKKRIESEKNRHLADRAFVLRKYEDVLKVKELITKAEYAYNRVEGYSTNGDGNAEYWKSQLPSYQQTINLHQNQLREVVQNLSQKSVNVLEIEKQNQATDDSILALDRKLEELSSVREEMITQYKIEKEDMLKANENRDYLQERNEENIMIFNSQTKSVFVNPLYSGVSPIRPEISTEKITDQEKSFFMKR